MSVRYTALTGREDSPAGWVLDHLEKSCSLGAGQDGNGNWVQFSDGALLVTLGEKAFSSLGWEESEYELFNKVVEIRIGHLGYPLTVTIEVVPENKLSESKGPFTVEKATKWEPQ